MCKLFLIINCTRKKVIPNWNFRDEYVIYTLWCLKELLSAAIMFMNNMSINCFNLDTLTDTFKQVTQYLITWHVAHHSDIRPNNTLLQLWNTYFSLMKHLRCCSGSCHFRHQNFFLWPHLPSFKWHPLSLISIILTCHDHKYTLNAGIPLLTCSTCSNGWCCDGQL